MEPARKAILVGGLGRFQHLAPAGGAAAAGITDVKGTIAGEVERAQKAGFDVTDISINPEDPTWSVGQLRDLLKSKHFDGVLIGYGIRANKDWTPLFEDLVNTVRETSPKTKLGFSPSPADICGTIKRLFPGAEL